MKKAILQLKRALVAALFFLLVGLVGVTKANPVGVRQAREVGAKFVNSNTNMRTTANDLRHVVTYNTVDGDEAFHVFNTSNGFVIVAADDCAAPILGYSNEGCFDTDNIPVQMEAYLQDFVEQVQYGKVHPNPNDELTPRQWASVKADGTLPDDGNRSAVTPLLTSNWDQNCFYNSLCPEDANGPCGHVWTGGGPTAMGQIMRFWGYPATGTGSFTYTPDGYPQQSVNFGATHYNWANMPNQLTSSSSSVQVSAVATLLWHCGVAAQATYNTGGTGTTPNGIANALVNYFNYSNALVCQERMDNTDWMMQVKACLNLGRPIHYSAWGTNGAGLSFVCDGYDANDMLHFNWGMSGEENGYFMLSALNTIYFEYNSDHIAIFDIYPQGMPTVYTVSAVCYPTAGGTITGAHTYSPGQTCTLTANANPGYTFVNWTEGNVVVSTNASYSFTVTRNRVLVANFAPPKYTINTTSNPAGSGTVTITQERISNFDDGTLQGWTHIDADGDGYGWVSSSSPYLYYQVSTNLSGTGHNSSEAYACSGSYTNVTNSALTPDNYLVSPRTTLGGTISFYVSAQDANYAAEHFGVAVSTATNYNPNHFFTIAEWTLVAKGIGDSNVPARGGNRIQGNWYRVTVDLGAYSGQSGYLAIRHFNCTDQFLLCVDDVTIQSNLGNQIEQGANCVLTAVPNSGYTFESWTENGVVISTNNPCSIAVSSNRNIVANFCPLGEIPTGALNGLFSVSGNAQVRFSQGNLQYKASTNTWRFAESQLDYIGTQNPDYYGCWGGTVSGSDNANISQNYSGWIDLFGWGTSGWNNGNLYYYPYSADANYDIQGYGYGPTNGVSYNFGLTGQYANADWGVYNAISNGGNQAGLWRTLTGDEWDYLLNTRGTLTGTRYAFATVNGIKGLILVPDNWPEELALNDPNGGNYNSNTITAANWTNILEANGAVFLPAGGYRAGSVYEVGRFGNYWASSCYPNTYYANYFTFYHYTYNYSTYHGAYVNAITERYEGMSVRLVHPTVSSTYFGINATSNPVVGGTVTGAGSYQEGATCTLTASANSNYTFVNWTENGSVVSSNANYSFTVTGNRTLVANFTFQGNVLQGSINSRFSVGNNTQVYFSQGNLQYKASTNTWRFAESQLDYIGTQNPDYYGCWGGTVSGSDNANISQYYGGWIDLFGWGTSGWNNGNLYYYPYSTGSDYNIQGYGYGPTNGINYTFGLTGTYANADWGVYNAISNGGNQAGLWRTLTGDEWDYLLNTRNTQSGIRYAFATVNGIKGLILVPDDWPEELALNDPNDGNYNSNTITAANWNNILEANGAVFLPAGGYRAGSVYEVGRFGDYWASSCYPNSYAANYFTFYHYTYNYSTYHGAYVNAITERYEGMSVRLVHEAGILSYFEINATPNPTEGGTVTGMGNYLEGTTCTLTATPNTGYTFVNWTKNNTVVSNSATYTFTVTGDATFVAHFEPSEVTQTINLSPGTNWFSTYLDITLDDLKAALVAAMPNNNATITIKSKTQNVKYQNGRWAGQLAVLDVAQMYKITVPEACEISLEGVLVNPSTLTLTITPGANWIAFPYSESMSVSEFFGSFPVNNDVVKSKLQNTRYSNGRWAGQLNMLIPGQGYIYNSAATGNRTFTFPTGAK